MATAALAHSRVRLLETSALAPALVAVTLNGFWLYLGVLDVARIEPFAALTGAYYLTVAVALLVSLWPRRRLIRDRLVGGGALCVAWAVAAATLAGWLLATAVFRSDGPVARDAALLLVLASLPSALAVMGFDGASFRRLAVAVTALGLGLVVVDASALLLHHEQGLRFSPINELNPISAAQTTAFAAAACLALRPGSRRGRIFQAAAAAMLVAATIIPAGRGPLVGVALAFLAIVIVVPRLLPLVVVAAVAGVLLGTVVADSIGSSSYIAMDVPVVGHEPQSSSSSSGSGVSPISSTAIRKYLLKKSLRAVPDAPILGHGVGSLVDDSPEARRMIEGGSLDPRDTRTYPHNIVVEAAYSLGLLGLIPLLVCMGAAAVALLRTVLAARSAASTVLVVGVCSVAAVGAGLSGELGMDAYVWIALALPVALYVDRREATASAR